MHDLFDTVATLQQNMVN